MDPLSAIASAVELTAAAKAGLGAIERLRPGYSRFWKEFEKRLKPQYRDIPWEAIRVKSQFDSDFISLACRLIDGDPSSFSATEAYFSFIEPPPGSRLSVAQARDTVVNAAKYAASETAPDFRASERRTVGLLSGEIKQMEARVLGEISGPSGTSLKGAIDALREKLPQLEQSDVNTTDSPSRRTAGGDTRSRSRVPLHRRRNVDLTSARLLEELSFDDPHGAAVLTDAKTNDGDAGLIEKAQDIARLGALSIDACAAAAQIAARDGELVKASELFESGSNVSGLPESDRLLQLANAAKMAFAASDIERAEALVSRGRAIDNDHPSLLLVEATRIEDPDLALAATDRIETEEPSELSQVHAIRSRAFELKDENELAWQEIAKARSIDPTTPLTNHQFALLVIRDASAKYQAFERYDESVLDDAIAGLEVLQRDAQRKKLWSDFGHITALVSEARIISANGFGAAVDLESVPMVEAMDRNARAALAETALSIGSNELALRFLDPADNRDETRLLRADATLIGSKTENWPAAVSTLSGLLDSEQIHLAKRAAFALLRAAAEHPDLEWNEFAEQILAEDRASLVRLLKAERFNASGNAAAAERTLLSGDSSAHELRLLRDLATKQADWPKALDRSRQLITTVHSERDELAHAEIMIRNEAHDDADRLLERIAQSEDNDWQVRDIAFGRRLTLLSELNDLGNADLLVDEWRRSVPQSENAIWNSLIVQLKMGDVQDATDLVKLLNPQPRNVEQAEILAQVAFQGEDAVASTEQIAKLSDQFDRPEHLEAMVVAAALGIPDDAIDVYPELVQDLQDRISAFPDRFPNSRLLKRVDAPSTPEELEQLLRELSSVTPEAAREVDSGIRLGRMPLNAAIQISRFGEVARMWANVKHLPLDFGDESSQLSETADATDAIGGGVVWDTASIFVVGGLDETERIRAALPGSAVAVQTVEDASRAAASLSGPRPVGSAGIDPLSGTPFLNEFSDQELDFEQRAVKGVLATSKSLLIEAPDSSDESDDFASALSSATIALGWKPFLSSILLAQQSNRPLFSDDRAIRRAARDKGIRTFGSLALLRAMASRDLLSEQDRAAIRRRLASHGVIGVSYSAEELIELGDAQDWRLTRSLLGAVQDPAPWRANAGQRFRDFARLLDAVDRFEPDLLAVWVHRTISAAVLALPEISRRQAVETLLLMSWTIGDSNSPMSSACFTRLVAIVEAAYWSRDTAGFSPTKSALRRLVELTTNEFPAESGALLAHFASQLPPTVAADVWLRGV